MNRLKVYENIWEGRIVSCCKSFKRFVIRGERLIKPGDSWFFAKNMLVLNKTFKIKGKAIFRLRRLIILLNLQKL